VKAGDAGARRLLTGAVDSLERSAGLLRVNLNESAALEDFLLASLRIWARR
jgi:DNA polymerase-3 subunit delta'